MASLSKVQFALRHPAEAIRFVLTRDRVRLDAVKLLDGPFHQPLDDLVAYLGQPKAQVATMTLQGSDLVRANWLRKKPETVEQLHNWNENLPEYLFSLVRWNMHPSYLECLDMLQPERGGACLVFGGGIGSEALHLAQQGNEVWYCDLQGSPVWKFAEWRAARLHLPIHFTPEVSGEDRFDCIVAFNVFSVLAEEELEVILRRIVSALKPGGRLYCNHDFLQRESHPQIYDHEKLWNELVAKLPVSKASDSRPAGSDERQYRCIYVKQRESALNNSHLEDPDSRPGGPDG